MTSKLQGFESTVKLPVNFQWLLEMVKLGTANPVLEIAFETNQTEHPLLM